MSQARRPAWTFRAFQTFPADFQGQAALLKVSGSLAARSAHPAAADILRVARWNGQETCPVTAFQDLGDNGFGGAVQLPGEASPRASLVGPPDFLKASGFAFPEVLERVLPEWRGSPVLAVGWEGRTVGILRFSLEP